MKRARKATMVAAAVVLLVGGLAFAYVYTLGTPPKNSTPSSTGVGNLGGPPAAVYPRNQTTAVDLEGLLLLDIPVGYNSTHATVSNVTVLSPTEMAPNFLSSFASAAQKSECFYSRGIYQCVPFVPGSVSADPSSIVRYSFSGLGISIPKDGRVVLQFAFSPNAAGAFKIVIIIDGTAYTDTAVVT